MEVFLNVGKCRKLHKEIEKQEYYNILCILQFYNFIFLLQKGEEKVKWKKTFSVMTTTVLMASMFAGSAWANDSSSRATSVVSYSSKLQRELVQKKLEKQLKKLPQKVE